MLTVHNTFEQGSPEWHRARCGVVTASNFQNLMRKNGTDAKTRKTYMLKLAGERMSGLPAESYKNAHMERGNLMEAQARDYYAFTHEVELQQVAFLHDDKKRAGASPDAIIVGTGGNKGLLEIKTALPHVLIEFILAGEFPPEHKAQCQGGLWIAEELGVDYIDIQISHEIDEEAEFPGKPMPRLLKRAYRDDAYIKDLAQAVDAFNDELNNLIERVRQAAR